MKTIELTINGVLTTLTLEDVWDYCVSMWRWIAKEKRAGNPLISHALKSIWLTEHGFDSEEIYDTCFFCTYAFEGNEEEAICQRCPARAIDPAFSCSDSLYHWHSHSPEFYNKVNYLRTKRNKA